MFTSAVYIYIVEIYRKLNDQEVLCSLKGMTVAVEVAV
jgi:hypothetical protein